MLKIGLTGGIGCGKSTVAAIFRVLGVPVYYADLAAKKLMMNDPAIRAEIIDAFGQESYQNGAPNKGWIAEHILRDQASTARLNSIVHPATIADARAWMMRQRGSYALKEAALIFESGGEQELDLVIGVSAPLDIRIERVMRRDGLSRESIRQRMDRQMDESEKMSRCQFVIVNDDNTALIPQVLDIHRQLLLLGDSPS